MSAGIPDNFKIDFSMYKLDMTAKAWTRMLSQHWNFPVMKAFIRALIQNGPQWAYDEIVKQQEANTIYMAKGTNLDAIGRIVGQPRIGYAYDESEWFFSDRPNQGVDSARMWVTGAPFISYTKAVDSTYRQLILARIACNFNKFSSIPELKYLVKFATGFDVDWRVVGPMEAEVLLPHNISNTSLRIITASTTTTACDDIYSIPYPATLGLRRAVFIPDVAFIADRLDGHQCDTAAMAVSKRLR